MSTERKMIGLPAQTRSVPPVPIDYGTRGTPSLVVKTTKGTNRIKYELGKRHARFMENQIVRKIDSRNRIGKPGLNPDCSHQTQNECYSSIADSQANISGQNHFQFIAMCSISLTKHTLRTRSFEPESKKDYSPIVHSGNRRWEHPPPSSPRPPGAPLFACCSIPISKININKQAESHPTGFFVGKPRVDRYSRYCQSRPRAHLLHRTIERYHE